MRRLLLLLLNEFKLTRTAVTVNLIAVIQPTLMYILMSVIMVIPTFDMYIVQPKTDLGKMLLVAMKEVGSPIFNEDTIFSSNDASILTEQFLPGLSGSFVGICN